jgi:16S rRNA (guanine1207-N2)-methyltransferase
VALPESGRIAVFRPRAEHDISALPKDLVEIIQGFFPDHQAFSVRGYACVVAEHGSYGAAVVFVPRAKAEAQSLVARAMQVTNGGPVVVDGQKTDGVNSLLKECRRRGAQTGEVLAKSHGKIFALSGGDFADWAEQREVVLQGGFVTRPGMFSADRIDRGSAALAAALPQKLPGKVADLGAGWGYLARHVLEREDVTECHLIEAEHGALDCARRNVTDPRARFHWADVTDFQAETSFDHIVTNPPFHVSRAAEPALGLAFIAAAAQLLARRGTLWLVANRHLPYEAALSASFGDVAEVAGDASFKVMRAANPRRARR